MRHERYSTGWTDARTLWRTEAGKGSKRYGAEYAYETKWGSPIMPKKKVDAHGYVTDAKDMPIEACQNLWLVTYGDGWLDSSVCVEQEPLIWEVGNRLYWAGLLEHDAQMDQYKCKS